MKQLKNKMLVGTLSAALTLGGSFTGIVHSAFADEAAAPQTGDAVTAQETTVDGLSAPVFARLHGVDLRTGKAALSTAIILSEDLQDVYVALSQGSTLASIGGQGASDYLSQLTAMTQANLNDAVAKGNITEQQAAQLGNYAGSLLNAEINDANYRDSDNSTGDAVMVKILNNSDYSADFTQFLGMSFDDLAAEFNAGKSLEVIAKEKGIGDDKLIEKLKSNTELNQLIWGAPAPAPVTTTNTAPTDSSDSTVTGSTYSN